MFCLDKKIIGGRVSSSGKFLSILLLGLIFLANPACHEDPEAQFIRLDQEGNDHFARREYLKALAVWKNALIIRPDSPEIYLKIGRAHFQLADFSRAAGALHQVIRLQPDAWDVRLELAQIQLISGDVAAAQTSWEALRDKTVGDPAVSVLRGDIMVMSKRFDKAESAYRLSLVSAPRYKPALIKLAACYLAQGKIDEAEKAYRAVASLRPESPEILLQMGHYWWLKGDLKEAETLFCKAARLEPQDLAFQKMLVDFYFDTRQYTKCHPILDRILDKMPGSRPFKKLKVEVLLAQNQMRAADVLLEELSHETGDDIELHLLKGKYYLQIMEPVFAVSHFKAVVLKKPDLPAAHFLLGIAYLGTGKSLLARQSFTRALLADPYFSDAELALAGIYYKMEAFDLSFEHVRRVFDREPENFRSHMIMGNLYLIKRQYDAALNTFKAALHIHPDALSPIYFMALTAELSQKPRKALDIYRLLLKKNSNLADAAIRFAQLLIRTGKIDKAKKYFEKAAKQMPQNGYIHHILGEVYLSEGNTAKARASFERAITVADKLASSYLRLVQIHQKNQDVDEQIRVLKTGAANIDLFPEAYTRLVDLYRQKGNWEKAISTLETAVSRNSESSVLANNLAWLYLEREIDSNKAFQLAQFAYEGRPNDPALSDTLGWAYFKKDLLGQALWYLTEASQRNPDHPLIRFHLGLTYHKKGDKDRARSELEKALRLNENFSEADEARRILSELKGL